MFSNIVVALDDSTTSMRALSYALRLARVNRGLLHPIHIIGMPLSGRATPGFDSAIVCEKYRKEGERVIDGARNKMAKLRIKGSPRLIAAAASRDDIADHIVRAAGECGADLIVIGASRPASGTLVERVLTRARCPVLQIPAKPEPQSAGVTASRLVEQAYV
jgi:nucleotide-binding universal stress UspA family protein